MDRFLGSSRGSGFSLNKSGIKSPPVYDPDLILQDLRNCAYNPSLEQVADRLKAIVMTTGTCNPIPVQYNSDMLLLLEGYHMNTIELNKADENVVRLRKELYEMTAKFSMERDRLISDIMALDRMLSGDDKNRASFDSIMRRYKESDQANLQRIDNELKDKKTCKHDARSLGEQGIMVVDYAAKKDAETSSRFPPKIKGLLTAGEETTPEGSPDTELVVYKPTGSHYGGIGSALRIFNYTYSPKPKQPKKKKGETATAGQQDQKGSSSALAEPKQNAMHSRFGRWRRASSDSDSTIIPDNADRCIKTEPLPQKELPPAKKSKALIGIETAFAAAELANKKVKVEKKTDMDGFY